MHVFIYLFIILTQYRSCTGWDYLSRNHKQPQNRALSKIIVLSETAFL